MVELAMGKAGMGQVKGLIPMRLGNTDFSDLAQLCLE